LSASADAVGGVSTEDAPLVKYEFVGSRSSVGGQRSVSRSFLRAREEESTVEFAWEAFPVIHWHIGINHINPCLVPVHVLVRFLEHQSTASQPSSNLEAA
jgi:hypothetical protein